MSVKNKIYDNLVNKLPFGEWNPVINGIPTPELYYTYVFEQLAKIQAFDPPGTSDAEQYDQFGRSVAVSNTRIVVGAPLEDTTDIDAGSVYIFDIDGNEIAKIQAFDPPGTSDAEVGDLFGYSVAVSNTRIVVGAPYEDTTDTDAGSVYIFDIDGNQIAKIQAFDPPGTNDAQAGDLFGRSVAVSDTRIVVGAPFEDTNGSYAGSAYIFDIDGNGIAKIQAFDPPGTSDAEENDNFGSSVAVSDTRIVVGAYGEDTTASSAGAAYIFDIDGNGIAKIQAFDPPGTSDAEASDLFGYSVAVSDTRIVVGAYGEDTNGSYAGSAYIFDIDGNGIAKIQAFDPPGTNDAEANDYFSNSVSVSDTRIVVGANGKSTRTGAAYIFDIDGNELAKIQASDAEEGDQFGYSVAASDTRIVVGAPYEGSAGTDAGSVYIFQNVPDKKSGYNNNINNINFNKLKYRFTGKL